MYIFITALVVMFTDAIVYKVKADTSATFTITTIEGTAQYPLNFGDKLRVNIIQK